MSRRVMLVLVAIGALLASGCETVESLTADGDTAAAWQKFDAAAKKYDAALAKDPAYLPAMLGKAKAFEGAKKWADAETWYGKVLEKDAGNSDAIGHLAAMFTERGKALYKEKKYTEAATWYTKVATIKVPEAVKKTSLDKAKECRFQSFLAGFVKTVETLPGWNKERKILVVEGDAPGKDADKAKEAALDNAHAKLNALALAKSSKAKDAKALPKGRIEGAVLAAADWIKPRKLFGVQVAVTAETLARRIFEINDAK